MKRTWLIDLRLQKNISQEDLAKECDVTQTNICHIENGIRRPSPDLAQKIGKVLNFDWTKFYEKEE